jgi:hypothetical protein
LAYRWFPFTWSRLQDLKEKVGATLRHRSHDGVRSKH